MPSDQGAAQRLPAPGVLGLGHRQPGDQSIHHRTVGEHQGRLHQRPVGGGGGVVLVQGALPPLEAHRLDGGGPRLPVDVDDDGVLAAAAPDPLPEAIQGRRTGGPDDQPRRFPGCADDDLQVRVAHIQANDGHPVLAITESALAVHKGPGSQSAAAIP